MAKREEKCAFALLNHYGKCTACCSKNSGDEDCTGIKHETTKEYAERLNKERRLN